MTLWLLEQKGPPEDPTPCDYDETCGMVVRARTEARARAWADGLEGRHGNWMPKGFWLDPGRSSCVPINAHGEDTIILVANRPG